MNWVKVRRRAYFPVVLVILVAGFGIAFTFRGQPVVLIALAVVLFLPGLIARRLLADLLEGRKRMALGDHAGSLDASLRFLDACDRKPWIRHAIWGAAGIYTLDVRAMGLNNAGAALTEMGRLDEAERYLMTARDVDPNYPMPVFNLARVAKLRGEDDRVQALGRQAFEMGLPGDGLDGVLSSLGTGYARLPR